MASATAVAGRSQPFRDREQAVPAKPKKSRRRMNRRRFEIDLGLDGAAGLEHSPPEC